MLCSDRHRNASARPFPRAEAREAVSGRSIAADASDSLRLSSRGSVLSLRFLSEIITRVRDDRRPTLSRSVRLSLARRPRPRLGLLHDEFIEQGPPSLVQEVSECIDRHRRGLRPPPPPRAPSRARARRRTREIQTSVAPARGPSLAPARARASSSARARRLARRVVIAPIQRIAPRARSRLARRLARPTVPPRRAARRLADARASRSARH